MLASSLHASRACRLIVILVIVTWFLTGSLVTLPHRVSAEVTGVDSIGIIAYDAFRVEFAYTWTTLDCIQGILYLDNVFAASSTEVCGLYVGEPFANGINVHAATGTYRFDLKDTTTGVTVYSRSWNAPNIRFTVGATRTTANVGDAVGIEATLTLLDGGPDEVYTEGNLTVSAGQSLSAHVYPQLYGAHYATFQGVEDIPQYREFTMTVPLAFGSVGTKTINVSYWDPALTANGSSSVTIRYPASASLVGGNEDMLLYLSIVALIVSAVGVIVGLMGYRAARRAIRTSRRAGAPITPSAAVPGPAGPPGPQVETAPLPSPPQPPQPPG